MNRMFKLAAWKLGVVLMIQGMSLGQTTRPIPQIKRALIISVDGLRPDLLLRANTPNMHGLFAEGCFSFWARTTEMSVTLPSHTSMLTGVTPATHGITFNDDGPAEQVYPKVPTLFECAKKAGYTTGLVATKSKFSALAKGVDWVNVPPRVPPEKVFEDEAAAEMAVKMIAEHTPQVMFVHFGGVDVVGHAVGWGTPQQITAIEKADGCVGRVLGAIKAQHLEDSTFIILTADHGGTGKWHGPDDPRARHIPWIAMGPGIRKNLDLTTFRELSINTEDTFATTCWLLNIPLPAKTDGKAVMVIAQDAQIQLMHDTATQGMKARSAPQ